MPHQDFEKYAHEQSMAGQVANNYKQFFKKHINPINANMTALDFGCGDGKYFPFFKQYFRKENIYGLEISQVRINRCKKIGWNNVQKTNRLEKIPFPDNFFDFINFDQVIEHIPEEELSFYIQEMHRILKKDAKIILLTPNYPIKHLYDLFIAITTLSPLRIKDDPTHILKLNFKKTQQIFLPTFTNCSLFPTGGILYTLFKKNIFSHKIIGLIKK
jgi:ubiquinone/menaquinone biosynthesis C-methylase UbiE